MVYAYKNFKYRNTNLIFTIEFTIYNALTNNKIIRWEQRFSNFNKALKKLSEAIAFIKRNLDEKEIDIYTEEILGEILKEGLIQRFEYTHELAWNVMKDFLVEIGDIQIYGSKDATREAFNTGLIEDGDVWMEMIKSRNKTSYTYNEETADEIFTEIVNIYHTAFLAFQQGMESKKSGEQQNLFDKK